MIDIYKIGLHLYKDIDKNSGLHEYNLIKEEIKNLKTIHNILLILNGKHSEKDDIALENIWNNYDIHIFIVSDEVALNDELANKCDYVLHQSIRKLPQINKPQMYSYVPELFYNNSSKILAFKDKISKIFFAGGIRDNEEVFKYVEDTKLPTKLLIKSENGLDNRIDYKDCQYEMSKYTFALIVSRKSYQDIGFVTARFAEAINNSCIPIVLDTYDSDNIWNLEKIKLENIVDFYTDKCSNEKYYYNIICRYKHLLCIRRKLFTEQLLQIDKNFIGAVNNGNNC